MTTLEQNIHDIVTEAIGYAPPARALVVFDAQSTLSRRLTDAYRVALPAATFHDFDAHDPEQTLAVMNALSPGDLVVLVQSGSFRLDKFRIRLELFRRGLAVIEHPHLDRMESKQEQDIYVDALAYDKDYYRTVGPKIKSLIDSAQQIKVICEGAELTYTAPFEPAKLNIGDYTGMQTIGGQFPIGEVFTEPQDLTHVNGTVKIFAYGDTQFRVSFPATPITLTIKEGTIVDVQDPTEEFTEILNEIREEEGLWVRELGFGMNRAMTRTRTLPDIGSYERMCGIHLSMGGKHTIYKKQGFPKRTSHYHVDIFAAVKEVTIDSQTVWKDGAYCV